MILENFLNGPNGAKFENRKIAEILANSVKLAFYGHSKWQNSSVFQDINLKLGNRMYRHIFSHPFSSFLKIQKKILESF